MKRVMILLALVLGAVVGCTVGQGEGWVRSQQLKVEECWNGPFDLQPDFFAAVPYRNTQQIRVQHGSDLQEVSDGVALLVQDTATVREHLLGQQLRVGVAPELWAEISPGSETGASPLVNLALYLQFSCHNQNVVLYAIDGTIVFDSLFSGDPHESSGAEKLTEATFNVQVADPRQAIPGTTEIPEQYISDLEGYFRFHFLRGQPGQPFP